MNFYLATGGQLLKELEELLYVCQLTWPMMLLALCWICFLPESQIQRGTAVA